MDASTAPLVVNVDIYENQRYGTISGWGPGSLLITDRKRFSTADGRLCCNDRISKHRSAICQNVQLFSCSASYMRHYTSTCTNSHQILIADGSSCIRVGWATLEEAEVALASSVGWAPQAPEWAFPDEVADVGGCDRVTADDGWRYGGSFKVIDHLSRRVVVNASPKCP